MHAVVVKEFGAAAVLQPGDYVGEMSLIDNEPHSATVRAEIQTDMLVLARADFARRE